MSRYKTREWRATPGGEEPIRAPCAFAYNPTVAGTKSEDTFILFPDGAREVVTHTPGWPMLRAAHGGQGGAADLSRPDILRLF